MFVLYFRKYFGIIITHCIKMAKVEILDIYPTRFLSCQGDAEGVWISQKRREHTPATHCWIGMALLHLYTSFAGPTTPRIDNRYPYQITDWPTYAHIPIEIPFKINIFKPARRSILRFLFTHVLNSKVALSGESCFANFTEG